MLPILLLFVCCALSIDTSAQRQSVLIAPQTTDPQITTNLSNHFVSINPGVAAKNQLFVFLPGTGGVAVNQLEINRTAADLGFHSINLNYPNDEAVNTLCAPGRDLDCYARVRLETKDGTDRTTLVNVNRPNSIENRLIKLLVHLHNQAPNANWGQFLIDDSAINWSKIVIAGHSQGGGHAAIIGRYHSVIRVVMFAAMDFNGAANAPANWIALPNTTPNASAPEKFWGFSHLRDDSVNFNLLSNRIWPAFGMPPFGLITNVDSQSPPFGNTHSLTTDLPCENAHGCIVVDTRLTRLPDGTPVYKPVWEYLLSNTASPLALASISFLKAGTAVTPPLVGLSSRYYEIRLTGGGFDTATVAIINGVQVETSFISTNELKAKLPPGRVRPFGTSAVRVRNSAGVVSNELNF